MFPTELPAEIVILILSYLPIPSISSLRILSKEWLYFIDGNAQNRNTIYRNAAWIEGYIPDRTSMLDEIGPKEDGTGLFSERTMHGVEDWKDFCKRRRTNARAWAGRAPSIIMPSPRQGEDATSKPSHHTRVHRIKVDEQAGITMATTQMGGFIVRDLETDEVLWELPTWYVRPFAHLEYGRGFMIFDRDDGNKEVWRREAVPYERPADFDITSKPDERQENVVNYLVHLSSNTANFKGRFTPHAVLNMPEPTRAYRFVYPTLLVASLERAYLWDVTSGTTVQVIENIQVIRGPEHATQWLDDQVQEQSEEDGEESQVPQEISEVADALFGSLPPEPATAGDAGEMDADDDDDDDDDGSMQLPQFLGLVRYVDLSERHVFFAGRYLVRVFSRETGKCILDIPSIRWRYGRWRWEVRSKLYCDDDCDTYEKARKEGREAVRVPLKFSYEEYSRSMRNLVDQFVAVHVSEDGKHLVAMLSGSRLVVIHHFEELAKRNPPLDTALPTTPPPRSPSAAGLASMAAISALSTTSSPASQQGPGQRPIQVRLTRRQFRMMKRALRLAHKRLEEKRDRDIFEHTMDIQLGPPAMSCSVYLAYENGRIGVVTTNSVYVVIPEIPTLSPTVSDSNLNDHQRIMLNLENDFSRRASSNHHHSSTSTSTNTIYAPYLQITRFPFFSNPSWLTEISCLMMSDTGLYVNWNFRWPLSEVDLDDIDVYPAMSEEEVDREKKKMLRDTWEMFYEGHLEDYETDEGSRYLVFANGDMYVAPAAIDHDESDVSTIYSVNFLPRPGSLSPEF
ncbi:hypothetical protein D9613_001312 [Agrocybe pediades]|uniref:F-box domain-containing protein n=1 Tax=Agrocybe pediades TaxID=84607 RepID=A0A8H4R5B5_9AGAR|nr:hypothetical protein D9613_001312 [Agrocybe pediades]